MKFFEGKFWKKIGKLKVGIKETLHRSISKKIASRRPTPHQISTNMMFTDMFGVNQFSIACLIHIQLNGND